MMMVNKKIYNLLTIPRWVYLFAIILLFANKISASVDSLQQVWVNVEQPDSSRFNALNEYYTTNLFSQPDSAILVANYHIELAQKKHSEKQRAMALNKKGIAYNIKGEYNTSIIEFNQAFDIFSSLRDSINIANTYNNLAIAHTYLTEYPQALSYYSKCLVLTNEKKLEDLKAKILLNTGLIYLNISNYDLALSYFYQSQEQCEKLELENIKGVLWSNIGYANFKTNNYHQAIEDSRKALKILTPLKQQYYIADNYSLHARIYQELNQNDTAMFYLEKGLEIHQVLGNNSLILEDQIILANIIFPTDINRATQIGEDVLKKAEDYLYYPEKIELYNLLHKCYEKKENYPLSLFMLEKHNAYSDSLIVEQDKVSITKKAIQTEYDNKFLREQIKNEQNQSQLKQNQLKLIFLLLFLISLFILYTIFFARSKKVVLKKQKESLIKEIDQLKELESTRKQLVHTEKMASLGQLTAGVAHEINNNINFISSGVVGLNSLINNDKAPYKPTVESVKDLSDMISAIEEGAKRTSNIVRSLHLFSREDTTSYIEVDIIAGLESTFKLLSDKIRDEIILKKYFEKDMMFVCCYPGQLNQVFMNVLMNAVQAVEGAGTIEVKVQEKEENIIVSIGDNGYGISDDVKQRIFEPFYTTKGMQEGTGLGLSISSDIMKKHKGKIEVTDNHPKGTKFVITLPKQEESLTIDSEHSDDS